MITNYITQDGRIVQTDQMQPNSWINLISPTTEEMKQVAEKFNIPIEFIQDPLDLEESARIEYDEDTNSTLIINDFPIVDPNNIQSESFITIPIGIIIGKGYIITICSQRCIVLDHIQRKRLDVTMRSRFLLEILLLIAALYNNILKKVNKERIKIEGNLRNALTNKQLYDLMELEKSLVYFLTSLTANGDTIKRLFRTKSIKLYEEDEELLEDLIIENTQAINTTDLYTRILESITESYSSLISNEMNNIMKILTLFTVFLTLPTLVFSFFGMNVHLPHLNWLGTVIVALFFMASTFIFMMRKNIFK